MEPQATPSPADPLRILLLEDSALDATLVTHALADAALDARITRVDTEAAFVQAVEGNSWDLILADYVLPGYDGLSALAKARESIPGTPFIFVSGALGEEVAVETLKRGATDFVLKQRLDRLPSIALRALAEAREREERRRAQEAMHQLLEERTTLLHELEHRVKNNLQLLLSLIGIEIRQSEDAQVRQVLGRVRERLHALATAYRDLYGSRGFPSFDVTRFLHGLCEDLVEFHSGASVVLDARLDPLAVEPAKAAPLALFLNEIVAKTLFNVYSERSGRLEIAMVVADGRLRLTLRDEAVRIEEIKALREDASGTILRALARQLDASLEWPEDDSATLVRVVMPVERASPP